MDDQPQKIDLHLMQLVFSLQAGAMQQLGKVVSPVTGKIERDLELARHTIDIIDMLNSKMKGNLTEEEEKFLGHVLYELRLNFVDESGCEPKYSLTTLSPRTSISPSGAILTS